MIGKVYGGGIDNGIPSNIGNIKVFCQKEKIALSKGTTQITLKIPFELDKLVGVIVLYGGYICGQPMLDNTGNYNNQFGLSFSINTNTKTLNIYSAGSYTERDLKVLLFYE